MCAEFKPQVAPSGGRLSDGNPPAPMIRCSASSPWAFRCSHVRSLHSASTSSSSPLSRPKRGSQGCSSITIFQREPACVTSSAFSTSKPMKRTSGGIQPLKLGSDATFVAGSMSRKRTDG